ncbi:hypothetical protein D3C85_1779370 [compost metagenome]
MLRPEMLAWFCEGACYAFPFFKRRSVLVGPLFRLVDVMLDTSPRTLDLKDCGFQESCGSAKRKEFKYTEAAVMVTGDELESTKMH